MSESGSVAFFEFLFATAGARIVTTDILQWIANRIMAVVAMRTVDMALVIVLVMIVIAIGTVHVIFLIHL